MAGMRGGGAGGGGGRGGGSGGTPAAVRGRDQVRRRPVTAALALLVVATALATVVPARARGWPTTGLGLVVLLITAVAYAPAGWPYVSPDRMPIVARLAAAAAAG